MSNGEIVTGAQTERGPREGGNGPAGRILSLEAPLEAAAAALLARAFRDNPVNRAVIGGDRERRLRVNGYGMELSLLASRRFANRRVFVEGADSEEESAPSAALVAMHPGGYPVAAPPIRAQLRCLFGQGLRVVGRYGRVYRLLDRHHPKDPHAYLALIATRPERQGRGLGRALLEAWLRDVDALGVASYLETDRRELLAFYGGAGFEVTRELRAFDIPIWCMQRPARARDGAPPQTIRTASTP